MPSMLDRLHDERDRLLEAVDEITRTAEAADRDLSTAELELVDRHRHRVDDELDPQITALEEIEVARSRHTRAVATGAPPALPAASNEPAGEVEVYRTFAQYARDELVRRYDAIGLLAGGPAAVQAATERLQRVVANTTTTDVAGLWPRTYMTQIMQVISTARPIVESARQVGLTNGKLTYPAITQKPIVGKQTAEKTELPSQAMQVQFVDVNADTYGGAGDLSWQAINWTTPDALGLWFDLCAEQYAIQTEAATGTVLAALTAGPVVPATPTLADWMTALTTAAGTVYKNSRRMADTIWADITTGYSIIGLVSNTNPIFLPAGGFSLASGQGNIAGLNLVLSAGLPAKTVIVGASQQLMAAETPGAPVQLRAVEPSIAGMQVGIVGAFVAKVVETAAFVKLSIT